jgi:hypothetical protein
MAIVLTITSEEVADLAMVSHATYETRIDAFLAYEQEAIELQVSLTALNSTALRPLVRRAVAKLIAARLLGQLAREEGASGTFQGAGITLSNVPNHALDLESEAWRDLGPYKSKSVAVISTPNFSPASQSAQSEMFGRSESERVTDADDE